MTVIKRIKEIKLSKAVEVVLYIVGYIAAFLLVQLFFDSFVIDEAHKFWIALLSVTLIYILNKTIKNLLVALTIPLTGMTLGLFYFVINTLMLKIVDIILGPGLNFTNIWILFFISIVLSIVNILIESVIIKPVMRRLKHE